MLEFIQMVVRLIDAQLHEVGVSVMQDAPYNEHTVKSVETRAAVEWERADLALKMTRQGITGTNHKFWGEIVVSAPLMWDEM